MSGASCQREQRPPNRTRKRLIPRCYDFVMAYVVTRLCQGCKDTACMAVCPVDCFYEPKEPSADKPDMLYINPDECIDCDACVPECPWEAIYAEADVPKAFTTTPRSTSNRSITPNSSKNRSTSTSRSLHPNRSRRTNTSGGCKPSRHRKGSFSFHDSPSRHEVRGQPRRRELVAVCFSVAKGR